MDSGQIPYGYRLKDGKDIEEPNEILIIKKMSELYAVGNTTYEKLADLFNTKYKSDKLWTKSKVKRVLEDKRYLGYKGLPPAISQETFDKIMAIKDSRNRNKLILPDIEAIKEKAKCYECNKPYKRHTKTKKKSTWYCSSGECKTDFRIEDHLVKNEIITLINKVIRQPDLLNTDLINSRRDSNKITKIKNQIDSEIEKSKNSLEEILKVANELVQERYNSIKNSYEFEMTDLIKKKLENKQELKEFDIGIFNEVVKEVLISHTGKIYVKFANDKIIS